MTFYSWIIAKGFLYTVRQSLINWPVLQRSYFQLGGHNWRFDGSASLFDYSH